MSLAIRETARFVTAYASVFFMDSATACAVANRVCLCVCVCYCNANNFL